MYPGIFSIRNRKYLLAGIFSSPVTSLAAQVHSHIPVRPPDALCRSRLRSTWGPDWGLSMLIVFLSPGHFSQSANTANISLGPPPLHVPPRKGPQRCLHQWDRSPLVIGLCSSVMCPEKNPKPAYIPARNNSHAICQKCHQLVLK